MQSQLRHANKRIVLAVAVAVLAVLSVTNPRGADTILHSFAGGTGDGAHPYVGRLTLSGDTLYGMTQSGGSGSSNAFTGGVVFRINSDGTGFSTLHEFAGGSGDGAFPQGSLTLSGSTLYGMTHSGGSSDNGVVFKTNTDGTAFTVLHEFAGGSGDGSNPYGSLVLSGSTLYGMTRFGGISNVGVVFAIGTDGTGFTLLHHFVVSDGVWGIGSLTVAGSTLYGMAYAGGSSGGGVVFRMNADGTDFTILHNFAGGSGDGYRPYDSLTLSGNTLYGMTTEGGSSNRGVVFKINTDGTGFTVLHSFAGGSGDGSDPTGSLTLSGSTIYGTTSTGGTSGVGVVFSINSDGTAFNTLHEFTGISGDGSHPHGSLTLSGSSLYGMTHAGGNTDQGVVFTVATPSTATCSFTGFLMPIGGEVALGTGGSFANPLRAFKLRSTIPVKFVASCDGEPVTTGVHTLQAIKYSSAVDSDVPIDATPTDAATTGNQFRLTDANSGEWHFNMSTRTGFSQGTWLLRAVMSDGSKHEVWITIKN